MYYVYVLLRKDSKWYIGSTKDLRRRMAEHTKQYPCELMYYEAYRADKTSRQREKKLKYFGGAWRALRKRITA